MQKLNSGKGEKVITAVQQIIECDHVSIKYCKIWFLNKWGHDWCHLFYTAYIIALKINWFSSKLVTKLLILSLISCFLKWGFLDFTSMFCNSFFWVQFFFSFSSESWAVSRNPSYSKNGCQQQNESGAHYSLCFSRCCHSLFDVSLDLSQEDFRET